MRALAYLDLRPRNEEPVKPLIWFCLGAAFLFLWMVTGSDTYGWSALMVTVVFIGDWLADISGVE